MAKKTVAISVLLFLMLAGFTQIASAVTIPEQSHIILESIGDPETADPAWAYDTASAGLIFQVYDTLIAFDAESVEEFLPQIATEWTVSPDGLTYTFKIRGCPPTEDEPAVLFHDGTPMTTEDVEYSFEHIMVQDRSGGPEWMFYEPLHGRYHADMDWPEDETCPINTCVQRNDTHVWFNLHMTYPPFMQILSQSWGSILNKDFCIAHGDWPGTWDNWKDYHNPPTAPLDVAGFVMCGTGPYMLDYWRHGVEWSVVRHEDYFEGWPAPHCSGYADRLTEKVVYEWGTRLADFRAGTADTVYVPRAYIDQVEDWPGIRGSKDIPTLICTSMFFNFDINSATAYCGSQQLDGEGIPLDFLGNVNVRKAFAHAMEYDTFLEDVFLGEAEQPPSPHIRGLSYAEYVWDGGTLPNGTDLPPIDMYYYDETKIEDYMKAAIFDDPLGAGTVSVWDRGFKMTITYNAGNVPRMTIATMLQENIQDVFVAGGGGTVEITTTPVTWSTYLGELWYYPTYRSSMPLYIIGWLADYPDPHNFVMPFQHSEGDFAYPSSYYSEECDTLIEGAISETDENARPAMYHDIAQLYYEDCPSVCTHQALGRRWERDWVQGWYYNAIFPMNYYRHIWKGLNGDINGDNTVNILDLGKVSAWLYDPPVYGPDALAYDYSRIADISPALQYQTLHYGPTGADGPLPYPSVGLVDLYDAASVNAHWEETVG
jgi:peptide/nickel transport system substrate-binding protein